MVEEGETAQPYEAPRIERVMTPADLECEVLYAGQPGPSQVDNPVPP